MTEQQLPLDEDEADITDICPTHTPSLQNVMPMRWTCYKSPKCVSLQSISLIALTCDIYI